MRDYKWIRGINEALAHVEEAHAFLTSVVAHVPTVDPLPQHDEWAHESIFCRFLWLPKNFSWNNASRISVPFVPFVTRAPWSFPSTPPTRFRGPSVSQYDVHIKHKNVLPNGDDKSPLVSVKYAMP